jgi:hypothetical protein
MIADFDDLCTWMYALISDLFAPLAAHVARPGPTPACTDTGLITMAIVGEWCGWDQETVLLSHWRVHHDLFPHQPERSRVNRRHRDRDRGRVGSHVGASGVECGLRLNQRLWHPQQADIP